MTKTSVLSTAYFPPIQWFSKLISGKVILESYEFYEKQSYRNRCIIQTAAGQMALSVPIKKSSSGKPFIKDIEIDYTESWQIVHRRAIESAYMKSPFYEYYSDALEFFFEIKERFLFDFNLKIINTLCYEISLKPELELSEFYIESAAEFQDFRSQIHPKKSEFTTGFQPQKYTQVFFDRFPFMPDLSILDLLFNEGPLTTEILEQSVI